MAFGQAAGPPAPQREVDALATLLEERGYETFKEARHPFGLTQRQAAGKFTAGEVAELVVRIESGEGLDDGGPPARTLGTAKADERAEARRRAREEEVATKIDAEVLATELSNRGWCVIPPE